MALYGIDISRYQDGLDLSKVPCDFVIIYVTGGLGVTNPVWEDQTKAALAAGKRVLFYHYAHDGGVKGVAAAEARRFLDATRPYMALVDGSVLDWESQWQDDVPWALEWLTIVRRESGKQAWFYAYYGTLTKYDFGPVCRAGFPLWEAAYVLDRYVNGQTVPTRIDGHNPPDLSLRNPVPAWGSPTMWQYTSTGFLPGWAGKLDLNVYHGTPEDWRAIHTLKEAAVAKYTWPIMPGYEVTQEFGTNPGGNNPAGGHTGRDFATPEGTPIYAPGDGTVIWADWVDDSWEDNILWLRGGISVALDCGDTEPTFVFGHLSRTDRNEGERVRKGDLLGYTGNTGYSSGPHLHFEVLMPGFILNSPTLGRSDPRLVCTGYPASVTAQSGTTIKPIPQEDTMTPEQSRRLDAIYDAIFNGGTSMPEGKPLKDLIKDGQAALSKQIAAIPAPTGAVQQIDVDALAAALAKKLPAATGQIDPAALAAQLLDQLGLKRKGA